MVDQARLTILKPPVVTTRFLIEPCSDSMQLLRYLICRCLSSAQSLYSPVWRLGYSKAADTSYYANHCPHCSRLQGSFMIFTLTLAASHLYAREQHTGNRADVVLKGGTYGLSLTLTEKICKDRTHKKTDLREQVCFLRALLTQITVQSDVLLCSFPYLSD